MHLSAEGEVGLSYLGTDPPSNTVATLTRTLTLTLALTKPNPSPSPSPTTSPSPAPNPNPTQVASEAKELNYEAMDEEHRRLLQTIREASSGSKPEPADGITLRAQVP